MTRRKYQVNFSQTPGYEGLDMSDDVSNDNAVFLPDRIQERVREWLIHSGWSVRQVSPENAYWAFGTENPTGLKIVVGQDAGRENVLFIEATIVDAEMSGLVDGLPEKEREEFLWTIRFELLHLDVEFNGVEAPLKTIRLAQRVFFDGLTQDLFFQRLTDVMRGIAAVEWHVSRRFKKARQRPPLGFRK